MDNLAKALARRQKRVRYWKEALTKNLPAPEMEQEIRELLNTYTLLLARLAKPSSEADSVESEGRLLALERQLTALFEESRLITSELRRGRDWDEVLTVRRR